MPNRRITLARVPRGLPVIEDFGADSATIPEPGPGQFLSRTLWLSLDPYLRNVMKNNPLYADRLRPGDVLSSETVAQVVSSQHPEFARGDFVAVRNGWQEFALSTGAGARKLNPALAPVSTALGVLGMPGLTGYAGLVYLGEPKPERARSVLPTDARRELRQGTGQGHRPRVTHRDCWRPIGSTVAQEARDSID